MSTNFAAALVEIAQHAADAGDEALAGHLLVRSQQCFNKQRLITPDEIDKILESAAPHINTSDLASIKEANTLWHHWYDATQKEDGLVARAAALSHLLLAKDVAGRGDDSILSFSKLAKALSYFGIWTGSDESAWDAIVHIVAAEQERMLEGKAMWNKFQKTSGLYPQGTDTERY